MADRARLLITGRTGQVGGYLAELDWPEFDVMVSGREDFDFSRPDSVRDGIRRLAPDFVINAAAYTAVDRAESEPDLAFAVNRDAPGAMAEELARRGGLLIHYSTDYVFDGAARRPYREEDPVAPAGVYGASKLAGEAAIQGSGCDHLVLRTSWVYGHRGHNFLLTMLRLAAERDRLRVVADQFGTPTFAHDLATWTHQILHTLVDVRDQDRLGLFHLGNEGVTTWHGFACAILERSGYAHVDVVPIETRDYPTPARRPAWSVLDKSRAVASFGLHLADWEDGMRRCLDLLGQQRGVE